tara:strand:- start:65791 stop:67602 length:1812 start_codon:yes stop_codon:yes gene_type:complete
VLEYFDLDFNGNKCCCPLHGEKTPSLQIYEDTDSWHCFGCSEGGDAAEFIIQHEGLRFPAARQLYEQITGDYTKYEREDEQEWTEVGKHFDSEVNEQIKKRTGVETKGYRGIRTDVSRPFGVRYQYSEEDGSVSASYYPTTKGYKLSGYKVREHPKKFDNPYGDVGKDCEMFGQHKFKTFTHTVMIVGGEIDQMSAFQIMSDAQKNKQFDPIAVVSSTVGESAAFKQVQNNYEFFNQFKKIVICMDNDKAGEEATKKLVEVLPKGRVFIMKTRYKDPNSYIWDKENEKYVNKETEFVSDFWSARQYTPEGVKSAADGISEIRDELMKERITLPPYMHKMQSMMGGGMIQGRIASVIADTSVGKSSHVNRMVYHWIFNSPVTPTIVSLEATAAQYMLEMLSIHVQTNLLWKMSGLEILDFLETPAGIKAKEELCYKENGEPRFFIIDDRAGSIKDMEVELEMLFRKHDSKLFVIDVLTDLLRGSSEQFSEDHMSFQRNLAKNGVTIVNVMHTRKPPQKEDGKPRKVTEYDALGTGSFVQSAAYNIVLNRDKLSKDITEKNTTEVDLPKCRGGQTGAAGKWYYDFPTSSCYDLDDYKTGNRVAGF